MVFTVNKLIIMMGVDVINYAESNSVMSRHDCYFYYWFFMTVTNSCVWIYYVFCVLFLTIVFSVFINFIALYYYSSRCIVLPT